MGNRPLHMQIPTHPMRVGFVLHNIPQQRRQVDGKSKALHGSEFEPCTKAGVRFGGGKDPIPQWLESIRIIATQEWIGCQQPIELVGGEHLSNLNQVVQEKVHVILQSALRIVMAPIERDLLQNVKVWD